MGEAFALLILMAVWFMFHSVCSAIDSFFLFFVEYRHIFIPVEAILVVIITLAMCKDQKGKIKYWDAVCMLFPATVISLCCISPGFLYTRGEYLAAPTWELYFWFPILVVLFGELHHVVPKWKNAATIIGGCAFNIVLLATIFHKSLIILADYFAFKVPF